LSRDRPVLETRGLTKAYGPHVVLDGITVSLDAGTIGVISGANGTGKSTLLRCIAGLIPFDGDVTVAGLLVTGDRSVRRCIGYMPQSVQLPENVTVGEVLAFFAKLRGVPPMATELAEGFLPSAERPIGILSGGQRQRVALAVALLGSPPLLLLDEPVANLDEHGRETFWTTLQQLRSDGTTALIASPLPADLAGIADRAIVLDEGRVSFDGPMDGPRPVPFIRHSSGASELGAQGGGVPSDDEPSDDEPSGEEAEA
jgi:ABC-type multidrug transport system ATPase subunit